MRKIKASLAGLILFVLIASGSFITCEIGLGGSVDTKPPTVSITYPPVDSIIKNTFTMKGSANDETALKGVSVSLTDTNPLHSVSYGPFEAVIEPALNSWNIFINKNTAGVYEIPDGSYQATVTATDTARRTSIATTTYKIDNTPPVLVIQSPSSLGSDPTFSAFGRDLKISGIVSDTNSVASLVFTAYDFDTKAMVGTPQTITSIPPNIDITFSDTYYQVLYPNPDAVTSTTAKNFYYTVSVTDYAKEYTPQIAVGDGNTSSSYYIYDKIYSTVFGIAVPYTMTDLQNIFNGAKTDTNNIKAVLATNAVSCSTLSLASGKFSINPENSPTFEVQTFDPVILASLTYPQIAKKSRIGLQVSIGRDNVPIVSESIGIVLHYMTDKSSPLDTDGTLKSGSISKTLLTGVPALAIDLSNAAAVASARAQRGDPSGPDGSSDLCKVTDGKRDIVLTSSGGNYLLSVLLNENAGYKYYMELTGRDQNKAVNNGSSKYGFNIKTSGLPPQITETIVGTENVQNNKTGLFSFGGTVECANEFDRLTYTTTQNGTNFPVLSGTILDNSPGTDEKLWNLPLMNLASGDYVFTFSALDNDGGLTEIVRKFKVDRVNPEITLTTNLSSWQRNTSISLAGTATDVNLSVVEYSLDNSTWVALSGSAAWNGIVSIPNGATNELYLRAMDTAGNFGYPAVYPVIVKVDDAPPDIAITTPLAYISTISGSTKTSITFTGSISDTLGLKTVDPLSVTNNEVPEASVFITYPTTSTWSWTLVVDAGTNANDGTWELVFSAEDASGLTRSITRTVTIETKKPVVSLNMTPSDATSGKYNGTIPVKASISDDNSLKSVYWQITSLNTAPAYDAVKVLANDTGANIGTGWNQTGGSLNNLNTTWDSSATGIAGDETRYLWIIACDRFGNISIGDNVATPAANASLTINQDTDIPVVTFTNYDPSIAKPYVGELTLKGTVSDDDGVVSAITAMIGVTPVTVTVSGGSFTIPMTNQGTKALMLSVTDKNSKAFTFDAFTKLKVTSGVTVIQPAATMDIIVDNEDPDLVIGTAQNQWMGTNFTLSGTATDEFNIANTQVTISGAGFTTFTQLLVGNTWTAIIPTTGISETASNSLTVSTIDGNGRTRQGTFQYKFDKTLPDVAVTTDLSAWKTSTSLTLAGTASDVGGAIASGVQRVELSINGGTNWQVANLVGLGPWTWSSTLIMPEGTTPIQIRITDTAGNSAFFDSDSGAAGIQDPSAKIDSVSPLLSVVTPGDGLVTSGGLILAGTVTELNPNLVEVKINSGSFVTATGFSGAGYTISNASLSVGMNTLTVRSSDMAGNSATTILNVYRDNTAPTISFSNVSTSVTSTTVMTDSSPAITGSITDASGVLGADSYVETWNGSAWILAQSWTSLGSPAGSKAFNWTKDLSVVPFSSTEGRYRITIRSSDITSNISLSTVNSTSGLVGGPESVVVKIDRTAPELTITTPVPNSYQSGTLNITGTAGDETTVSSVRVKIDSNDFTTGTITGATTTGGFTVNPDMSTDTFTYSGHGLYIGQLVYVYATTLPTGMTAGTPYYVISSGFGLDAFKLSATSGGMAIDFTSNGSVVRIAQYDALWAASLNIASLSSGAHTFYIEAKDGTGKATLQSQVFYFDNIPPTVGFYFPAPTATVYGVVSLRGTASDDIALDSVKLQIGKMDVVQVIPAANKYNWSYSMDTSAFANTTHATETYLNSGVWQIDVDAVATDATGNITTTTLSFFIDNDQDKPKTTIITPVNNDVIGGSFTFKGVATDGERVMGMEMQVEFEGATYSSDQFDFWNGTSKSGGTSGDGDANDLFENRASWYPILGTTSWDYDLNKVGELYKTYIQTKTTGIGNGAGATGRILVRVRAYDTKSTVPVYVRGVTGNYQQVIITLNEDIPSITSVTPANNSSVRGSFLLGATIYAPGGLDKLEVSIDGGQNYISIISNASGTSAYVTKTDAYNWILHDYSIDTTVTPGTGPLSLRIRAVDVSVNRFTSISYLSLEADNTYPTNNAYIMASSVLGTAHIFTGQARDLGTVGGLGRVELFVTNPANTTFYQLKGSSANIGTTTPISLMDNTASDAIGTVNYPGTISDSYVITIDRDEASVSADADGYYETLQLSSGKYDWSVTVNSTLLSDGKYNLHYIIYDKAGNGHHYVKTIVVQNNRPTITSIDLATDLNGDADTVDSGESLNYTSFGDTGFNVRGSRLTFTTNDTNGNGTKYYAIHRLLSATAATSLSSGSLYRIKSAGTASFISVGASSNNPGTIFVATGTTAGGVGGEAYLVSSTLVNAGSFVAANTYWVNTVGTTDFTLIGAPAGTPASLKAGNAIGTFFTATGAGAGTGTAFLISNYISGNGQTLTTFTGMPEDTTNGTFFALRVWDSTAGTTAGVDSLETSAVVHVTVDNIDGSQPQIAVAPLGQRYTPTGATWALRTIGAVTSYDDNMLWTDANTNDIRESTELLQGHVEYTVDSLYDNITGGADADVSGIIKIRGKLQDNIKINQVTVSLNTGFDTDGTGAGAATAANVEIPLATFVGSSLSPLAARIVALGSAINTLGFTVDDKTTPEQSNANGHIVNFTLTINTAFITNTAATNVVLTFRVYDGVTAVVPQTLQFDVVPYISSIVTQVNTLLSADFNRTAKGRYPVQVRSMAPAAYETVLVNGFNLRPSIIVAGAMSDIRLSKDPDGYDATYATKQGTGLPGSSVATNFTSLNTTIQATGSGYLTVHTNGIPSMNNVNKNAATYNAESSSTILSLDDDRYLSVWDLTPLRENATAPNSKNAVYPSMALSGNTVQFAYQNNSQGYGLAQFWTGASETKIYENWDLFTFTALDLNTDNSRVALYDVNIVQSGVDTIGDKGGIMMNLFYDPPNTTWNGSSYFYRDNNVWLDNLYKTGNLAVLDRYQYPDVATVGNNALTHVFYSVYDSIDDRVIFRYFRTGTNTVSVGNAQQINNQGTALYVNNTDLVQRNENNTWPLYTDSAANNTRFGGNNNSGNTNAGQYFATGTGVGLHSAVGGVSTGALTARGILVYYSGNTLYYQYATNDANTTWSAAVSLDTGVGGDYVSMIVDKDSHVHIAYQDSFAGDVKYIYIPTYTAPATNTRVIVDSYLTVGEKLSLTVPRTSNTPYITYKGLGNTSKIAWLTGALGNGVGAGEKLNGAWEIQVLPNKIVDSDSNRFLVGVGTNGLPVVGYSNSQAGKKGIEYMTGLAELVN